MCKISVKWIIGPSVTRVIEHQEENTRIDVDLRLGNALLSMMSEAQNKEKTGKLGLIEIGNVGVWKDTIKKVRWCQRMREQIIY